MAPTYPEYHTVACPVGATNIAIATTLVASDLVVVVGTMNSGGGRSITPSGLGTWNTRSSDVQGIVRTTVDSITGVTGTGTITITVVGSAAEVSVWVVRGLVAPTVYSVLLNDVPSILPTGPLLVAGPQDFTADQGLIQVVCSTVSGNTYTGPSTGTLPSTGAWTMDNTAAGTYYSHTAGHASAAGDGTTDYALYFSRATGSSAFSYVGVSLVLGEPAANALMLASEYVETVTQGPSRLEDYANYAEVLTRGTPQLVLDAGYVELVTKADNVLLEAGLYVEVLTKATLGKRGWGILI